MPRLQALIGEMERWVRDHGPVTYDGKELWGVTLLQWKNGELYKWSVTADNVVENSGRRKNPARKGRGDERL